MITKEEIKSKILELLGRQVKFADAKLADGTMVQAEAFEVGKELLVVAEDGGTSVAPDGEHTLEDGSVIVVANGLISEIKAPEVEPAQTEVEVSFPMDATALSAIKQSFAVGTPEERLANLELISKALIDYAFGWELREAENKANRDAAINIYKQGLSKIKEDFTAITNKSNEAETKLSKVEKYVKELEDAPAAKPTKKETTFKKEVAQSEQVNFSAMTVEERAMYYITKNQN